MHHHVGRHLPVILGDKAYQLAQAIQSRPESLRPSGFAGLCLFLGHGRGGRLCAGAKQQGHKGHKGENVSFHEPTYLPGCNKAMIMQNGPLVSRFAF